MKQKINEVESMKANASVSPSSHTSPLEGGKSAEELLSEMEMYKISNEKKQMSLRVAMAQIDALRQEKEIIAEEKGSSTSMKLFQHVTFSYHFHGRLTCQSNRKAKEIHPNRSKVRFLSINPHSNS
jgi:hypothetical protein